MNQFSFMKFKWVSLSASTLVFLGFTAYTIYVQGGYAMGLDFGGGLRLDIVSQGKITPDAVSAALKEAGVPGNVEETVHGNQKHMAVEVIGRNEPELEKKAMAATTELETAGFSVSSGNYLVYLLQKNTGETAEIVGNVTVGSTVGPRLRKAALNVLTLALVLITIYVAFRFRMNYAIGAFAASIHDVVVTMAIAGILQIPLSIPVLAAVLTILGYSINDTIVIFDRIRENMHGSQAEVGMDKVIDKSIWQSMTRTINTSATTLLAIIPVFFFGGEALADMALVLIIGILVGTYSSTFIASPFVSLTHRFFAPSQK